MESSDEDLMNLVAQGNRMAFEALVVRYVGRAHALAQRILHNHAEAEEQVQEALTRVWVHAHSWQPARARFSTWFTRILVNACLDTRRRRHVTVEATDEIPSADPHAGQIAEQHELSAELQKAVAALPSRQRTALVLHYF